MATYTGGGGRSVPPAKPPRGAAALTRGGFHPSPHGSNNPPPARPPARRAPPASAAARYLPKDYGTAPVGLSPQDKVMLQGISAHTIHFPLATLAKQVLGIGPGLYALGKGLATHPGPTLEQTGKAIAKSTVKDVSHPIWAFEHDPLGLLTTVTAGAAAAGKVAAVSEAARAGGTVAAAKAVLRTPPVERELRLGGGETAHPLPSRNPGVARFQKHVVDRAVQHGIDHPGSPFNLGPAGRFVGARVKAGREQRAAELVRQRVAQAAGTTASHLGGKLNAAERKAVMIVASGRRPEEWAAMERNAIAKPVGRTAAHQRQLRLTGEAQGLIETPKVQQAAEAFRQAVGEREQVREMTPEAVYHRLGAHSLAVAHGAAGFEGDTPMVRALRLETQLGNENFKIPASDHAATAEYEGLKAQQAAIREQTAAREKELGVRYGEPRTAGGRLVTPRNARRGDGILINLNREGSRIATRLDQLDRYAQARAIHEDITAEGKRVHEQGGFYIPLVPPESSRFSRASRRGGGARESEHGISAAVANPRDRAYLGGMVARGDYRTNVGELVSRAHAQTQWLASQKRLRESLYQQAKKTTAEAGGERYAVPVRPTRAITESLRAAHNLEHSGEDRDYQALVRSWYDAKQAKPGEEVRYIDRRTLGPLQPYKPLLGPAGEGLDRANQLVRVGRYLVPGYLRWLPQNFVFVGAQQGPFLVRSAIRFKTELPKLEPAVRDKLYEAMGMGPSRALVNGRPLGLLTRTTAEFWNKVNDTVPRALAFIHEAEKEGFRGADGYTRLLTDPANERALIRVARRAENEAGNYTLTNAERATLKKLMTSYPWTKAASRWSGRLLTEHPYQSRVYAQAGEDGKQEIEQFYAHLGGLVPSWLRSYMPFPKGVKIAGASLGDTLDTSALLPTTTPTALALEGIGAKGPMGETAPVSRFVLTSLAGVTKAGTKLATYPKTVERNAEDLAKRFQPVGIAETALAKPKPNALLGSGPAAAAGRLLGSPFTQIDLKAAASSGEKEYLAAQPVERRIGYRVRKEQQQLVTEARRVKVLPTGGSLPANIARAYQVKQELETDLAKLPRGAPELDRYKAVTAYVVKAGLATQAQADQAVAQASKLNDRELRSALTKMRRGLYSGIIAEAKRYVNAHGGNLP